MVKKYSKKYTAALEKVDVEKQYSVADAAKLVKDIDFAKFDANVEVVMNLNVDTTQAEQQLRGAIVLPNGSGKNSTVVVFADGDKAKEAEAAGADVVGSDDLVERIQGGWLDFDVAIATPNMMAQAGKVGRTLGPKGLMPNPKEGTVTMDVAKAVENAKGGQVTYRTDRNGNIAISVGKVSFDADKLAENMTSVISTILSIRPATVKGTYVKSAHVSSTFGPGIAMDISGVNKA